MVEEAPPDPEFESLLRYIQESRGLDFRTTDGLRSYKAAIDELGNAVKEEIGRYANNRAENSHLPFRRRERAMLRFRQMKSLQKFASVHASLHNHFSQERHLVDRKTCKERRSVAWTEWPVACRLNLPWGGVRSAKRRAVRIRLTAPFDSLLGRACHHHRSCCRLRHDNSPHKTHGNQAVPATSQS